MIQTGHEMLSYSSRQVIHAARISTTVKMGIRLNKKKKMKEKKHSLLPWKFARFIAGSFQQERKTKQKRGE